MSLTGIKTSEGFVPFNAGGEGSESIQVSTLPTASIDELGKVYQYIGTTTQNYTHGYFYECQENSGSYSWIVVPLYADEITLVTGAIYESIGKETGSITLSTKSVDLSSTQTTGTVNVIEATGSVSVTSSDPNVVTASISNNTITLTLVNTSSSSTPVITVNVAANDNYYATSDSILVDIIAPDIPNADDPYVVANNITNFINSYTSGQVGFQGNGNGKVYVAAGDFGGTGTSTNPNIDTTGTLIYNGVNAGNTLENYESAAHLCNIMNYILYYTKGYGSEIGLFPDTPTDSSNNKTTLTLPNKGFYEARGWTDYFSCYGGRDNVSSFHQAVVAGNDNSAVWW